MNWINLNRLLLEEHSSPLSLAPEWYHRHLRHDALRLAGGLQAAGIKRLAVHLKDASELAVVLLGAWRAGVTVLLPADSQPASRERLAGQFDQWIGDDQQDATLASLMGEALSATELDLDNCYVVLCTSGSSGEPKLIEKCLRQLSNEVEALEALWGPSLGQAVAIGSVVPQHIYGLLFRLLWPLCAGRPFLRHALPFPEDLQLASLNLDGRDFYWVCSPALLKRVGDNLDWMALQAVRKVFSSGGPLPSEAGQFLAEKLGQFPSEIYGSSETGGIAWRQGGTLWQAFAEIELDTNEQGALRIRSPYLPSGHTEQSADAVRFHADRRFELLGRMDRIVKLEEKRISLPALEQALSQHPWVSEARLAVIQENRAFLGALLALSAEGLHALRNQGRKTIIEALRQHLAAHCEALALPRRWRLFSRLPANSQGKLTQATVDSLLASERPKLPDVLSAQAQQDQWQLELEVPLDLAYFTGHFPSTPVLPGVVQIDWAQHLAQQYLQLPIHFAGMEVLKFQQLVRPGDRIQLQLRFDASRHKLYFSYQQGENAVSSGRILLKDVSV